MTVYNPLISLRVESYFNILQIVFYFQCNGKEIQVKPPDISRQTIVINHLFPLFHSVCRLHTLIDKE